MSFPRPFHVLPVMILPYCSFQAHGFPNKKRKGPQSSRKIDCAACIVACEAIGIRRDLLAAHLGISEDSLRWRDRLKITGLAAQLFVRGAQCVRRVIFLRLPTPAVHNHDVGFMTAGFDQDIDSRVHDFVRMRIKDGVFSRGEMQRHLNPFVRENFPEAWATQNAAFCLRDRSLSRAMCTALLAERHNNTDEKAVLQFVSFLLLRHTHLCPFC